MVKLVVVEGYSIYQVPKFFNIIFLFIRNWILDWENRVLREELCLPKSKTSNIESGERSENHSALALKCRIKNLKPREKSSLALKEQYREIVFSGTFNLHNVIILWCRENKTNRLILEVEN